MMREHYPEPDDMVTLAEAIEMAEAEIEAAHTRERMQRQAAELRVFVETCASQDMSTAEIVQRVAARVRADPEWLIRRAEEIAEAGPPEWSLPAAT